MTRPRLPGPPLFLRIWLVLVAVMAFFIAGVIIYGFLLIVSAGPEGIARSLGAAIRAFNEASQ